MNNVKFNKIEKQSFTVKEMRAFGFSMLDCIRGDIVDCETGKLPEMKLAGNYTDEAKQQLINMGVNPEIIKIAPQAYY